MSAIQPDPPAPDGTADAATGEAATASDAAFDAAQPRRPALNVVTKRLSERLGALDPVATPLGRQIRRRLGAGKVKETLSGTALGHPAHPLLTDVVIGCLTSASLLDVAGGERSQHGAQVLVRTGVAAAAPTIASGWADWADSAVDPEIRRIGVVHALTNATGVALYGASMRQRAQGRRGGAAMLGLAGAGMLGLGGFLGGHLSYVKGVGVNETAFESGPEEWTAALPAAEVHEGRASAATVAGVRLLVTRHEGRIVAFSDRCTHRGGALHEGELRDGCVECPLHGSVFSLADGSVMNGPASTPQPVYDVRVRAGQVEVRAAA